MVIWPRVAGFLLVGYLTTKRSFAYLGVPPLFIGEIVLVAFLLLKPRVALGTWTASLFRLSLLNELGIAMLVFMAYGVWQVGRGVLNGHPFIYTAKFFIFNYYTLYIFLGMWVAFQVPDFLRKTIRVIGWMNGIYGLSFIVALRYVGAHVPGTDVPLFSPPSGQAVVILGLLCFERDLRPVWFILLLNIVITLVWQVRAEWLGLALGIFAWGLLTGRLGRVVAIGMAGVALLGMMELADIRLAGRSGESVSLSDNLARVIAPIDLELAKELSPQAAWHAGTAEWRELWWDQIWLSVHSTPRLEAFGHGYGFDLFGLAPDEVRAGQEDWDVRTPHSVFFYALGYTGWVGVALFSLLQLAIFRLLWRSYRLGGQAAGVVFWVMGMGMAFFQENFDSKVRWRPREPRIERYRRPVKGSRGPGGARSVEEVVRVFIPSVRHFVRDGVAIDAVEDVVPPDNVGKRSSRGRVPDPAGPTRDIVERVVADQKIRGSGPVVFDAADVVCVVDYVAPKHVPVACEVINAHVRVVDHVVFPDIVAVLAIVERAIAEVIHDLVTGDMGVKCLVLECGAVHGVDVVLVSYEGMKRLNGRVINVVGRGATCDAVPAHFDGDVTGAVQVVIGPADHDATRVHVATPLIQIVVLDNDAVTRVEGFLQDPDPVAIGRPAEPLDAGVADMHARFVHGDGRFGSVHEDAIHHNIAATDFQFG
jgi:hypothetical protein